MNNVGGKYAAEERGAFDLAQDRLVRPEPTPQVAVAPLCETVLAHWGLDRMQAFFAWYEELHED